MCEKGVKGELTGLVEITDIGTSAVGVDLVDGDGHDGTGLDRRDGLCGESSLGVGSHVDVTGQFGSSTLGDDLGVDLGVADDGGVLLARRDRGTVAGYGAVHCQGG